MVKSFDFHPVLQGSIPVGGNFFKKSQIFLIPRGFQKFRQKTWNQQLLFYYSKRRGQNRIIAPSSDSSFYKILDRFYIEDKALLEASLGLRNSNIWDKCVIGIVCKDGWLKKFPFFQKIGGDLRTRH